MAYLLVSYLTCYVDTGVQLVLSLRRSYSISLSTSPYSDHNRLSPLSPLQDRMLQSLQLLCSLRFADTAHMIGPAFYATRSSSVVLGK
jgi:hypothetical protein